MSMLTLPPTRWLLALAVRLLRAPAIRRRLLPPLFPGRTAAANGRVYPDRWEVAPPALGSRCVPGCDDPSVDWDGVHYCRVVIGQIHDLPATRPGGTIGLRSEPLPMSVVHVPLGHGEVVQPRQILGNPFGALRDPAG